MTNPIRIELDSVEKWSNKSEYRTVNRASCMSPDKSERLEVVGDGQVIVQLCRLLADNWHFRGQVEVWRGETLVFTSCPVKRWLKGLPTEKEQPDWLRKTDDQESDEQETEQ